MYTAALHQAERPGQRPVAVRDAGDRSPCRAVSAPVPLHEGPSSSGDVLSMDEQGGGGNVPGPDTAGPGGLVAANDVEIINDLAVVIEGDDNDGLVANAREAFRVLVRVARRHNIKLNMGPQKTALLFCFHGRGARSTAQASLATGDSTTPPWRAARCWPG